MPGKVMHADTSKFEKIETRFYKINFFSNVAKAALLLHSHEKVSALLLILAIKHWFFNTLKNVLRFEKSWCFDKFLPSIMGNASKRIFVHKFQMTLISQGYKVRVLKKRAFYYVKLKISNFDNL